MTNDQTWKIVLDKILPLVETPAQYIGKEWNSIVKDHSKVDVTIALAFPDIYTIGMSHLGLQILYSILNDRSDVAAERVYTPWPDMESKMREMGIPLLSLETHTPIHDFDIVGFSLQYEMSFTNVLNMLNLASVPLKSRERTEADPLIIAGGPCASSPEPLADFIDLFLLGDGEELIVEFVDTFKTLRSKPKLQAGLYSRQELILELASRVKGVYAPSGYDVDYDSEGRVKAVTAHEVTGKHIVLPMPIEAAIVSDLDNSTLSSKPIVPYVETVHDRVTLEIMRGCTQGCRFCHAGMTKRPVRWRSVPLLRELAEKSCQNTGHSEISLASLSTSDYPDLTKLIKQINMTFTEKAINISLPSLRVDEQLRLLPSILNVVRKSGLTIAPEAATQRLRNVINKNISDDNLYAGIEEAFRQGWKLVKLYFMIGLPTETDEDIDAIVDMAYKVSNLRKKVAGSPGNVNISIAPFVPKAHTPFQWEAMATIERIEEIQNHLKSKIRSRRIRLKFHRSSRSFMEAVFSRGDRRLGAVLLKAFEKGCKFDAWNEYFDYDKWIQSLNECEIDPTFYANRQRDDNEIFPWDHLSFGVSKKFLSEERARAFRGEITPDCRKHGCRQCGLRACPYKNRS